MRRLLTRTELRERGIRMTNYTLLKRERAGEFPQRVLIARRVFWFNDEIEAWLAAQAAARLPGGEPQGRFRLLPAA